MKSLIASAVSVAFVNLCWAATPELYVLEMKDAVSDDGIGGFLGTPSGYAFSYQADSLQMYRLNEDSPQLMEAHQKRVRKIWK